MVQRPPASSSPALLHHRALCRVRSRRGTRIMLVELTDERIRMRGSEIAIGAMLDSLDGAEPTESGIRLSVRGEPVELLGMGAAGVALALARLRPGLLPALRSAARILGGSASSVPPTPAPGLASRTVPRPDGPAEPVLFSAEASWLAQDRSVQGQLLMTSSTLHFLQWPVLPDSIQVRWPRWELGDSTLHKRNDAVSITRGTQDSLELRGPGAVLAHHILRSPPGTVLATPASRGVGPLSVPGVLLLGPTSLLHVPTRALDRLAGRGPVALSYAGIAEIGLSEGILPSIGVHADGQRLSIATPETQLVADLIRQHMDDDLARAVLHLAPAPGPGGPQPRDASAPPAAVLDPAEPAEATARAQTDPGVAVEGGLMGPGMEAPLAISGARLTVEDGRWRYGTVVLHRKEVRFLPRAGACSGRIRIPVSAVSRSRTGSRALVLRARQRNLRFYVGDPEFVDRYWTEARTPDRIYHPSDHRARVLRRICVNNRAVRLWIDGELVCEVASPSIRLSERGLSFKLPGRFDAAPEAGTAIRVQFFHHDGVFELTTPVEGRFVSSADRSAGERGPHHVLLLQLPRAVMRFDKRKDRRMVVWAPARIHRHEEPDEGRRVCLGLALNLSGSGAALRSYSELRIGERVSVELQLEHDDVVEIEGTVMRRDAVRDCWGVRFDALSGQTLTMLLRMAREHERAELARFRQSEAFMD